MDRLGWTGSGNPPHVSRRLGFGLLGIAAVGLVWRLVVFARPLAVLDRLFIPDDTYYTLSIARSLAAGRGPTTDGSTLTSGFQALHGFLLVPVAWLVDDPDRLVRADLLLLIAADTITILLLGWVAYRLAGAVAAVVAAGVWAISPRAVAMALGGLETSLAVTFEVGLVAAWVWAGDAPSRRRYALVGVVGGLAVLARVDALALVGLLVLVEIARGSWRRLLTVGTTALFVVAPWWIWCAWTFGSPLPSSGPAAHRLGEAGSLAQSTFADAGAAVVGGPFTEWNRPRQDLILHPGRGVAVFVVITAALLAIGIWWSRSRPAAGADRVPSPRQLAAAFPFFGVVLLLFYVWFGVTWYLARYLEPVLVAMTLILAVAAAHAAAAWSRAPSRAVRIVETVALAGVLTIGVVASLGHARRDVTAETPRLFVVDGSTGWGEVARWAASKLPDDAVVGAWQSGALGFYGGDRLRVINLDGVVNPEAPPPSRSDATARYLRAEDVTYIADTDFYVLGWLYYGRIHLQPFPSAHRMVRIPPSAWHSGYSVVRVADPAVEGSGPTASGGRVEARRRSHASTPTAAATSIATSAGTRRRVLP